MQAEIIKLKDIELKKIKRKNIKHIILAFDIKFMNQTFLQKIRSPFFFKTFLLTKLPLAFIAGVKLQEINEEKSVATIRFGWINQNPFKSMYFAAMAMAAELSTGVLALGNIWGLKPSVSMLVNNLTAEYSKKAVGKITFVCEDGIAMGQVIQESIKTGEGKSFTAKSVGYNEQNEIVAVFHITWSFKAKK